MSCIFWNCQGIRSPLASHGFGVLLRKYRPDVIFLSEIRVSSHSINCLKKKWSLNGVGVSSVGLSGGLALLWRKNVQLELVSFSKYHIDAKLTLEDDGSIVRITGIYGEPDPPQSHVTWSLLRTLRNNE